MIVGSRSGTGALQEGATLAMAANGQVPPEAAAEVQGRGRGLRRVPGGRKGRRRQKGADEGRRGLEDSVARVGSGPQSAAASHQDDADLSIEAAKQLARLGMKSGGDDANCNTGKKKDGLPSQASTVPHIVSDLESIERLLKHDGSERLLKLLASGEANLSCQDAKLLSRLRNCSMSGSCSSSEGKTDTEMVSHTSAEKGNVDPFEARNRTRPGRRRGRRRTLGRGTVLNQDSVYDPDDPDEKTEEEKDERNLCLPSEVSRQLSGSAESAAAALMNMYNDTNNNNDNDSDNDNNSNDNGQDAPAAGAGNANLPVGNNPPSDDDGLDTSDSGSEAEGQSSMQFTLTEHAICFIEKCERALKPILYRRLIKLLADFCRQYTLGEPAISTGHQSPYQQTALNPGQQMGGPSDSEANCDDDETLAEPWKVGCGFFCTVLFYQVWTIIFNHAELLVEFIEFLPMTYVGTVFVLNDNGVFTVMATPGTSQALGNPPAIKRRLRKKAL